MEIVGMGFGGEFLRAGQRIAVLGLRIMITVCALHESQFSHELGERCCSAAIRRGQAPWGEVFVGSGDGTAAVGAFRQFHGRRRGRRFLAFVRS